jgi:hypothetical protein
MKPIQEVLFRARSATDSIRNSYNQEMLLRDPRTLFHYYIRLVHEYDVRKITRDDVLFLITDTFWYPVVGYNSDVEVVVVLAAEVRMPKLGDDAEAEVSDDRWDRFVRVLKRQAQFYHTD